MRSPADLPAAGAIGLVVLLTACADATPTPTPGLTPPPSESPTMTVAASPSPEPSAPGDGTAGIPLPTPGMPWDAEALLGEMQASTRPGGVPGEVQTVELADAMARTVWTVDGAAWDTAAIGGFCGSTSCTIDLAGTHIGRAGEDLWTLEVDLTTGRVEPVVAEVRSLPWDLVDALDGLARTLDDDGRLSSLSLVTTRWLPPPAEEGRFVLSYRSGGEEGSCARELLLDATRGVIVEEDERDC